MTYPSPETGPSSLPRVRTIDTHTAGEPTRIVLDGDALLEGSSLAEKRSALQGRSDWLRRGLMWEPRGHTDMFGAVLVRSDQADIGAIFMEHGGYPRTCIHGSIGVATVVLDHALVPGMPPGAELTIETAGGIVRAAVTRTPSGSVDTVAITQPPGRIIDSLVVRHAGQDVAVNVVGSSGWVVLVHEDDARVRLAEDPVGSIVARALGLRALVIDELRLRQPLNANITDAGLEDLAGAPLVFYGPSPRPGVDWRTFVMFGQGAVDRSPCGFATGNLAVFLAATSQQPSGEPITVEGSSGSTFRAWARPAPGTDAPPNSYQPTVAGRARTTGFHEFVFADDDEFREGFVLS